MGNRKKKQKPMPRINPFNRICITCENATLSDQGVRCKVSGKCIDYPTARKMGCRGNHGYSELARSLQHRFKKFYENS